MSEPEADLQWSEEMSRVYARYMEMNVRFDHRRWAKQIVSDWPLVSDGATVVDVAGGPAFLLLEVAALLGRPRLICTDSDPFMLKLAEERAGECCRKIETIVCPAEKMSLPDETADFVLCKHLLRMAKDLDATLHEAARILKPGGRAYFIDFNAEGPLVGKLLLALWIRITGPRFLGRTFWRSMQTGLAASSLPSRMKTAGFRQAMILRHGVSYLIRAEK